jgi:hypothetical protein
MARRIRPWLSLILPDPDDFALGAYWEAPGGWANTGK